MALLATIACDGVAAKPPRPIAWRSVQPGVELASIDTGVTAAGQRGMLYVVRVTPSRAELAVGLASETAARQPRTAAEWCRAAHFAVAINAGMFQQDHLSNVGYLRHGAHLNNPRWNDYRAVVAFRSPRVSWFDLDASGTPPDAGGFSVVIQNLRLITKQRKNVWAKSEKRWSEAALAIDSEGRLLFLFLRAPLSMHEFNDLILSLPLDVAGAMHLEGGPEASLSIHAGGIDLDLSGSYETGFRTDDSNDRQWALPNVLGVVRAK